MRTTLTYSEGPDGWKYNTAVASALYLNVGQTNTIKLELIDSVGNSKTYSMSLCPEWYVKECTSDHGSNNYSKIHIGDSRLSNVWSVSRGCNAATGVLNYGGQHTISSLTREIFVNTTNVFEGGNYEVHMGSSAGSADANNYFNLFWKCYKSTFRVVSKSSFTYFSNGATHSASSGSEIPNGISLKITLK